MGRPILLLLALSTAAQAQLVSLSPTFTLRKGVEDPNQAPKAASFTATIPKEGPDQAELTLDAGASLGDAALSLGFMTAAARLTGELHRKTSASAPQYAYSAGLLGDVIVGSSIDAQAMLALSASFSVDRVKKTAGGLYWVDLSGNYRALGINSWMPRRGWLRFRWSPTIGLEVDQAVAAEDPAEQGSATRLAGRLEAVVDAKLSEQTSLELQVGGAYRWVLSSDRASQPAGTGIPLVTATLTLWMDPEQRFGLGADYLRGADPRQGQAPDEHLIFSVKLKLDLEWKGAS